MKVSVCSKNKAVAFYWSFAPRGCHIEAAVLALQQSIERPSRARTAYLSADNENMFRERLRLAVRGRLRPSEHVKAVRQSPPQMDLFEIRWQDVRIVPIDAVSGLYGNAESVMVRLYYVEQGQAWVVGLHAHEKEIGEDDSATAALQDQEIAQAVQLAKSAELSRWGVPELSD